MLILSRLLAATALSAACLGFLTITAAAQFLGRSADEVVEVTLMEGWRMPNGNHMGALRIQLAPGWKTYWRAPGEGGVPTVVHLTRDTGIDGIAIHWPRPEVFFTNGMRSIGYSGDVILPIEFALGSAGDVEFQGRVDMGVCLDVCMPITLDLTGLLPARAESDTPINAALAERPLGAHEIGVETPRCSVEPISDGMRVTIAATLPRTGNDETVVVEHRDPMIWISDSRTRREGGVVYGTVDLVPADSGPFALNRSDLRITIIGSQMAVDLGACRG
jgi:DsbC/DsbD-like thiol-disulfide interchange protein